MDRSVKSDSNFPLEGDVSALGRSIVIMGPNHGSGKNEFEGFLLMLNLYNCLIITKNVTRAQTLKLITIL